MAHLVSQANRRHPFESKFFAAVVKKCERVQNTVTLPARKRTGIMANKTEAVGIVDVVLIEVPSSVAAAGVRLLKVLSVNSGSLRIG